MKLVVGLGNPGSTYARTRHNVGFWVVDRLAERNRLRFGEREYKSQVARGPVAGARAVLLKPQTYMNLSGEAVGRARRALRIEPAEILVVYDDLDLPLGRLRIRDGGGAGGHHGVESIIGSVGGKGFPRIRVGIGRPTGDTVGYLTDDRITPDEEAVLGPAVERAAEAAEVWLSEGIAAAMNRFNATAPPGDRSRSRVDEAVGRKSGKED
jgi:PTH1 family peptidyl-tRNA hydrolase